MSSSSAEVGRFGDRPLGGTAETSPPRRARSFGAGLGDVLASYLPPLLTRHIKFAGLCLLMWIPLFLLFGATFPKEYSATMVVGPSMSQNSFDPLRSATGFAKAAAKLKGLGVTGSGGDTEQRMNEYLALLTSQEVAAVLIKDPKIFRGVFHSELDDSGHWKGPGVMGAVTGLIKGIIGYPPTHAPDASDLQRYLSKRVIYNQDIETDFVTINLKQNNRQFALYFLNRLNSAADGIVRAQAIQRSNSRIAFLEDRLNHMSEPELRSSLTDIVLNEEEARMTASVDPQYATDVIVGASTDDRPSSPSLLMLAVIATVVSAGIFALRIYWLEWLVPQVQAAQ